MTLRATEHARSTGSRMRPFASARALRIAVALATLAVMAGSLTFAIAATSFRPPTWVAGIVPAAADLKDVAFTGVGSGYAVGADGAILRTADGGATWTALESDTTRTLNAVDAAGTGPVWAVGDNGTMQASNDGTSWSARSSGVATDLLGVDFVDLGHGWAVGRGGTLIATSDGGSTWTALAAVGRDTAALHGVALTGARTGWVWGDGGLVAHTTDGGSSWTTQAVAAEDAVLYAGTFLDDRIGWVAGSGGLIKKTTDAGATWTTQTVATTATIRAITFIDAERGFLVGGESSSTPGVIAGTADGGATWTLQKPVARGAFRAVAFADADHGLVVGDGGITLRTAPPEAAPKAEVTEPDPAPPVLVLAAPVGIEARAMQSGDVLVAWGDAASMPAPLQYRVWRSIDGEPFTSFTLVPVADGPRLVDSSAPASRTVSYKVSTVGSAGESSAGVAATVVTKAPSAPGGTRPASTLCTGCHTVHAASIDDVYPGNDGVCFSCHPEIGERLSGADAGTRHDLTLADQSAHGSRISCSNCHNAHIMAAATPIVDPEDPSPRTAMPAVTDAFCLACHDESLPAPAMVKAPLGTGGKTAAGDIAQTWGSDVHGGGRTAVDPHLRPDMGYARGAALACVTCHDPHGSTNRWTLLESVPSRDGARRAKATLVHPVTGGADLRLFCSGCHVLSEHPTAAQGGADLTQWPRDCTPCHSHGATPAQSHEPPQAAYQLHYAANLGGMVVGEASQTVPFGRSGTQVSAVSGAGYHFVGWSDGLATATRTDANVVDDVDVTASFAIHVCELRYTAGVGGTISGVTSQTVAYGGTGRTVTAVPDAGYRFVGWSDGVTAAARIEHGPTTDVSVTALFARSLTATRVTITSNRTSVTRRHRVVFSGTISSTQPMNTHVAVYARRPGSSTWVKLSTRHTTSSHRWSFTYSPATKGTWHFQVRFAGTAAYAPATSSSRKIAVK